MIIKGNDWFSNTYIIKRFNKCFIIDPSHDFELLISMLGDLELEGVLLTHSHEDHIALVKNFNVPVYIHKNEINELKEQVKVPLDLKILSGGENILLADKKIHVIHAPGHSSGSCVFLYENTLYSGDTLFLLGVGRYDLYGGKKSDLQKSVIHLIDTLNPNTIIYPGHGEMSTIRNEKRNNPFYLLWKKQGK